MTFKNGHDSPQKVTSLDEARKRAAEKVKAEKRGRNPSWGGPPMGPSGPRTPRDWLIGGLFIAMALGLVVWFVMRLMVRSG